ncbi:MAG: Calx-beta domain-containing protein, partial [Acidimicrobiales bacterium]
MAILASFLVVSAAEPAAAHAGDDCRLFAPADVAENDWFGSSAGIDGDTAVITAWIGEEPGGPLNAGVAYVYDRQPDGSWLEGQKLLPSNPEANANFGFSADIDGDIIAIGAWHENEGGAGDTGAVYVYERPSPTGTWTESARLVATDADAGDLLGYNLEVDAATSSIVVGAYGDDEGGTNAGAGYVFRKVTGTWQQEAKLVDPNGNNNERAGNDVAISGDWAVVGHHLDDAAFGSYGANVGGALVYERTGSTWSSPVELDGSDPPTRNRAGFGVDVEGDLLVMTGFAESLTDRSAAWVFRENGGVWTEEQRIDPYPSVGSGDHPDAGPTNDDGTHFGRHVEANNGVIAIGAAYDAFLDFERGATHYFTQDTNGLWAETARIDPELNAKYFHAGIAVALSDTHAVIGAEKGNLNDDGDHQPFQTSPTEVFNSGMACIGALSGILDGSHSPNPFYGVYGSVADATVVEGASGTTTQVAVDVTLSQAAGYPVTIDVATANGTATTADSDYVATSQTVTFVAGDTSETVLIDITGDDTDEADETFFVVLSNPTTGLLLEDDTATVTITNDDALGVSVGDASVAEGDAGNSSVLVDLSLSVPATGTVTVDVATVDGTATVADSDYVAYSDTVTFLATEQTKQVSLDVVGDGVIEPDELFTLEVTGTTGGLAVLDGVGDITITNDDANTVSVGDASVTEGPSGVDATATVDVTLSEAPTSPVDVTISSADGTATVADSDYVANSETVTFAIGETLKTVSFTVTGDDTAEADEVFNAVASNPTGGISIGDGSGDVTILNDDSITVSVGDASSVEGAQGVTTPVSVDITLSSPAVAPVSLTVATADGTATVADNDYTALSQTVNFAIGEDTQSVSIDFIGDDTQEPNEALTLVASAPSAGLTIGDGTGDISILNDDSVAVIVGDASITEGAAGTTDTVTVTVSLTQPALAAVDVDINTADDTATVADGDYVSHTETVSFLVGESSKDVILTVNGDDTPEPDEQFLVQASNVTGGATIADGTGAVTIVNDDVISVSIGDGTTAEGAAGGSTPVLLDVTLAQPAAGTLTVEVSTTDGTATVADSDYVAISSQVVTFLTGESTKQVSVTVNGDDDFEADETLTVDLSNPSGGLSIGDGSGQVTITNDDAIAVSVGDVSVVEGGAGTTATATVDVTLSGPADATMTVLIDTADGTATTADGDYVDPGQQTVTFLVTEQSKTVDITVNGDDAPEADETFSVVASGPTGGLVLGDDTGVVTITNDDTPGSVTVSLDDVTIVEGDAGTTSADVTISLSVPAIVPVSLDVSTADGTATTADSDYTAISGQPVSFAVGEQQKVVSIDVNGDTVSEPDETFTLVASNLVGAGVSFTDDTGEITIQDDEVITVSISDVSITEGDVGAKNVIITFALNQPSWQSVLVDYATADGTATLADSDYVERTGGVGWVAGDTIKTRGFQVLGDTNIEPDEIFNVVLSNPTNATLGQATADITILDDDTLDPTISVGDVAVTEGAAGTTATATVSVDLSAPAESTVTVAVDTADGTATVADSDYVALTDTVTFLQGEQFKTVDLTVNGDDVGELDELFTLVASNPTGPATLGDDTGEITITNDDTPPISASVGNASVVEGDSGTANVDVTVTLSSPATGPMSIDLATVDGTATVADSDYGAVSQTVNFVTNDVSQTISIPINGDEVSEPDEIFTVEVSNPTGGLLIADGIGEVTITDDDVIEVSISGIEISEGNAGSKNAILTFSLNKPSSVAVRVDYATADGTATLADSDYVQRSGNVQFAPLATTRTRGFVVLGDTDAEADEIFTVDLSNPINAVIGTGTANVTILDDDSPSNPLTVSDVIVVEGDAGTVNADVTLDLGSPSGEAFTVDVNTADGTATVADGDYTAVGQTVSFAIGDQSKLVSIPVNGDTSPEADEVFAVVASNSTAGGVDLVDNIGQVTITNDDLIDVTLSDTSVTEGAAATTVTATVDVSLSAPAVGTMTVDVATVDGSATTVDSDYAALTQTVTFGDGEQTKQVDVTVNGDDQFELDEQFTVVATSPSAGLNLADGTGEITITNDDTAGSLSVVIGGATVSEGASGSTVDALVDVTLSAPATSTVSLTVVTADGTATTADSDYVAVNQTVTFLATEQTKQVAITINGDDVAEPDEALTLVGSNPSAGLTILDGIGDVTILNDDSAPSLGLSLSDTAVIEGDAGQTTATVTVSLDQPAVLPVSVDVSTVDGTATVLDSDYVGVNGQTVSFGANEQSKTVDILVNGDTDNETDETFTLVASNPVGDVTLVDDTGEITITTDDAITISVGDVTLTEIDAGYKWAQVPFTLSSAPQSATGTVVVQYTSVDGTATVADNDYQTRTGELRFGLGVTSLTRGFRVYGDIQPEANETFTVELSAPQNGVIGDGIGEVLILDDDTASIGLAVGDATVTEGDAGTTTATVTLTLASPAVSPLTVDVSTVDGTATAGSDYAAVVGQTVTFGANEQSQTVDIDITGDTDIEDDEQFTLVASNPSVGLNLDDDTGQITITNDDIPGLTVSDVTLTEGDAGTTIATFDVDLDRPAATPISVLISTLDGSATTADADYTAIGQTVTFAANEQFKTVDIDVIGDTAFETDEQFTVVASNPSAGMTLIDDTGVVTITNDDTPPSLSVIVGDASVTEGAAGTTVDATVDVTLSAPAPATVTVDVATADGTATVADSDYVALPLQTLTFTVGQQTKQLQITVNGDDVVEADEQFTVVASNPTGGLQIIDGTGAVTIGNDDVPPGLAVSVADASVVEGESGTVTASVDVTLNQPAPVTVTVEVDTVDDTATTADSDYVAVVAQTVTFLANEQTKTVDVTVNGDTNVEFDESFNVVASNPSAGLSLGDDTGVVTITTDDAVTVSAGDVVMTEIDAGYRWAQMSFTLNTAPGPNTLVVQYATVDGTATLADNDYQERTGELRFANATTTLTRGFRVYGDTNPEPDEMFTVVLSDVVNGVIGDGVGEVTVLDDDTTAIGLTVGDVSVVEGDAGTTTAAVPLTLASPAVVPLTVDVSTADGTATAGDSDYTPVATQQVSFAIGEQSKTVDIDVIGDTGIEADELFTLVASNPSAGLTLADGTGEITITNDDVPPTIGLTVGNVTVTEGDAGTVAATVDVTLDGSPVIPLTVDIATADGTATVADGDYSAVSQQLTFAVGEQSKTVDVIVNGDTDFEADETLDLVASNPSAGLA